MAPIVARVRSRLVSARYPLRYLRLLSEGDQDANPHTEHGDAQPRPHEPRPDPRGQHGDNEGGGQHHGVQQEGPRPLRCCYGEEHRHEEQEEHPAEAALDPGPLALAEPADSICRVSPLTHRANLCKGGVLATSSSLAVAVERP